MKLNILMVEKKRKKRKKKEKKEKKLINLNWKPTQMVVEPFLCDSAPLRVQFHAKAQRCKVNKHFDYLVWVTDSHKKKCIETNLNAL